MKRLKITLYRRIKYKLTLRHKILSAVSGVSVSILLVTSTLASGPWESGDWVNYTDSRYVTACDKGRQYIYFATTGGILRWNFYLQKWDYPFTIALLPGEQVPFDTVYCVAYDQNSGYLWCGTSRGLLVYSTMSDYWERHILPLGDPPARSIGFGGGAVWLECGEADYGVRVLFKGSPSSGGFNIISPSELTGGINWRGERFPLPKEFPRYFVNRTGWLFDQEGWLNDMRWNRYRVTCGAGDGRGYTWLGFFGCGPAVADDNVKRLELHPRGPDSASVYSALFEEKDIWLGGKAFTRWHTDKDKWEYYPAGETMGFYASRIDDILRVGDRIFIATDVGLSIMELTSGRFITKDRSDNLCDPHATALAVMNDAMLWIGTAQGLNLMKFENNAIERIEEVLIEDRYIYDLALDGRFLWIGTDFGLYLHDMETGRWTYVRGTDETAGSAVRVIKAGDKEVWVGRDLGVEMFDKDTGGWNAYPSVFYRNRGVRSILAGDSIVWLGTDGGLFKLKRKLNTWTGFTTQDGLPSDTVNVIHQEGDYLWLGTSKGLCRFYWNDPYRLD